MGRKNYIRITLQTNAAKVYQRIIENKLRRQDKSKVGNWQCSFRPESCNVDFVIAQGMQLYKGLEWNMRKLMHIFLHIQLLWIIFSMNAVQRHNKEV